MKTYLDVTGTAEICLGLLSRTDVIFARLLHLGFRTHSAEGRQLHVADGKICVDYQIRLEKLV